MLPRIRPINPSRIAAAFDYEDWVFELQLSLPKTTF